MLSMVCYRTCEMKPPLAMTLWSRHVKCLDHSYDSTLCSDHSCDSTLWSHVKCSDHSYDSTLCLDHSYDSTLCSDHSYDSTLCSDHSTLSVLTGLILMSFLLSFNPALVCQRLTTPLFHVTFFAWWTLVGWYNTHLFLHPNDCYNMWIPRSIMVFMLGFYSSLLYIVSGSCLIYM